MTEKERRKGGGAKLTRTETVTVRLDPVTRYAAELAAAKSRQTLSSFLETGARVLAKDSVVATDRDGRQIFALELAEESWSEDENVRLRRLCLRAPHLLPIDKQMLGEAFFFFVQEIEMLMAHAGLEHVCHAKSEDGGIKLNDWHIADGAMDKIMGALGERKIDFDLLKRIARQELIDRCFITE